MAFRNARMQRFLCGFRGRRGDSPRFGQLTPVESLHRFSRNDRFCSVLLRFLRISAFRPEPVALEDERVRPATAPARNARGVHFAEDLCVPQWMLILDHRM
jgi:hypothetical protein